MTRWTIRWSIRAALASAAAAAVLAAGPPAGGGTAGGKADTGGREGAQPLAADRGGREGAQPLGTTERVRIVEFRFRPRTITVPRGTRIRWVNRGSVAHTATSDAGVWDSGRLDPGEAYSRRFRRAGTFAYGCEIHPSMTATVVVT